jgi:ERF superfamily
MSQSKKDNTQVKKPVKSLKQKLKEIVTEIGPVEKKGRHPQFAYTKAAQVLAELRHRLSDRNIYLSTSVLSSKVIYGEGKTGVFAEVETEHTFTDTETGESMTVKGYGLGWDFTDKGLYKAMTGALKNMLMDNFLITDEVEPEAGEQRTEVPPSKEQKHSRVKKYEEETGEGDRKVAHELLELKSFLTENKIPEGFLLRLLQEKSLIDGHTKSAAQLKPGVLTRCVSDKSKANLLKAWKLHQADEESGSAEPPDLAAPPELPANKGDGEVIRTKEGDQTVNVTRTPVQTDLSPKEVLEQDGYSDWRQVPIHFGDQKATPLGKLTKASLAYWMKWQPKPYKGTWDDKDLLLDSALVLASLELTSE